MNPYEITFIIRPDLDEEKTRAAAEGVSARIEGAGGEAIAMYPWNPGRRRMAYPIRDFGDGFYVTITFRLDSQTLPQVEGALRLNDQILRFLVVQATDQMITQSQQRMAQATAPPPPPQQPQPEPVPAAGVPEATVVENVPEEQAAEEAAVPPAAVEPEPEPEPEPVASAPASTPEAPEE